MKSIDTSVPRKPATDCQNMDDIRTVIDAIDQDIIVQLGQRFAYVKAASKFKTSATDVRAPERFKSMLQLRRQWAEENGLSPDAIEKLYRELVEYFISEEMQDWEDQQGK